MYSLSDFFIESDLEEIAKIEHDSGDEFDEDSIEYDLNNFPDPIDFFPSFELEKIRRFCRVLEKTIRKNYNWVSILHITKS